MSRAFTRGTAAEYSPRPIVNHDALRYLTTPRTWRELMRMRGQNWWREQVFALEWLGFAHWHDTHTARNEGGTRGSLTGTWSITDAGRTQLLGDAE